MEMNERDKQKQNKQEMFIPASPLLLTNVLKSLELEDKGVLPQMSLGQLAQKLQDKEWKVRLSAVRTLRSWNDDEEVDELLEKASEDEKEFVRMTAAHALEYRHCQYPKKEIQVDNQTNPFPSDPSSSVEEESQSFSRKKIEYIDKFSLVNVFCCFFSKDSALVCELKKCLSAYDWQGLQFVWYEHEADKEARFQEDISLSSSQINIFLIISPDLMASQYWRNRMSRVLERNEGQGICIIPFSSHSMNEEYALFNKLRTVLNEKIIYTLSINLHNEIMRRVIEKILYVIGNMTENATQALPNTLWHVPYARNPIFTGREKLLEQLHTTLTSSRITALTQPKAITGLGGIGKTQTAIEYAYRYRREYNSILWLNADTYESLLTDLVKLSSLLDLSSQETESDYLIEGIKVWLAHQEKWLLIFDNIDNLKIITAIISQVMNTNGHILFTTRAHLYDPVVQSIRVEKMDQEESLSLLLQCRESVELERDRAIVRDIARELDGLPLALDQARAYINETRSSWSEYLNLYRSLRRSIGRERGVYGLYSASSSLNAATTFSLTFQRIGQIDHTAIELLQLCAFLYPNAIPEEMVKERIQLHYGDSSANDLNKTIEAVQKYALIVYNKETKTLHIHQIIQALIKKTMLMRVQKEWATQAVRAINTVCFTNKTSEISYQSERYLSQALSAIHLIDTYNLAIPEAIGILSWTGSCLSLEDFYRQTEHVLYQSWSPYNESKIKGGPLFIPSAVDRLINIYERQKKFKQAELLYHYVTHTSETNHRFEYSDIPMIINELIKPFEQKSVETQTDLILYYKQQRKEITKRKSLNAALLLQRLAILYAAQENHRQSKETHQKALTTWKQALGLTPVEVLSTFHDLALLYFDQDKYPEAETLFLYILNAGNFHSHSSNVISTIVENTDKLLQHMYTQKGVDFKSKVLMLADRQAQQNIKDQEFFISYAGRDRQWAEWIAFELEAVGSHAVIQAWDIHLGSNFAMEINEAAKRTGQTILVLSEAYLKSEYASIEWIVACRADPKGEQSKVLPVRIERCKVEELLGSTDYIDLVGLDEQQAREQLLAGIRRERTKSAKAMFLGSLETTTPLRHPNFPGRSQLVSHTPSSQQRSIKGKEDQIMQTIKVLFLAANPISGDRLALDEEMRVIEQKMRAFDYRDVLVFKSPWAVRSDDLLQLSNQHQPQVLHFSGHGMCEGLMLIGDDGQEKLASTRVLRTLFTILKDNIRLVVLSACYSREQAQVLKETIGCVIGMKETIGDRTATTFASSFYRAIGFGRSIQEAFDQGISSLLLEGIAEEDAPDLLVKEGIDASKVVLAMPENL